MFRLDLSPLPCPPLAEDTAGHKAYDDDGFVDDGVVLALLTQPAGRSAFRPLAARVAADALDFAGWQFTPRPQPAVIDEARWMSQPLAPCRALA
jgi:hypothetical protein